MTQAEADGKRPASELQAQAVTEADWQWYDQAQSKYSSADLFLRNPLRRFRELVARAQRQEIPVNVILDFIDPQFRGVVDGQSYISTLGYFLDQDARLRTSRNGIKQEKLFSLIGNVDAKRLEILAALGQENPYIWRRESPVMLKQSLASSDLEQTDLVSAYEQAVIELYDYLESSFDVNEVIRFLTLRLTDYQTVLKTGKTRTGREIDQRVRTNVEAAIPRIEETLARLKSI